MCECLVQKARVGIAWDERRSSAAAFEERFSGSQIQSGHLGRAVTSPAILLKNAQCLIVQAE